MKKRALATTLKSTALLLSLVAMQLLAVVPTVSAAPQQVALGGAGSSTDLIFDTDDDPLLNDDPTTTATYGGLSINSGTEGSPEQTTSDSGTNQRYTWRTPDISDQLQLCSNAQLTSLRVEATVNAATESNPDLVTLAVYRIDGADMYSLGDYTVQQGNDVAPTTAFATPPNGLGVYAVGRGTPVELGGQLAGTLEATWDLSSFDIDDQFGIMVQQDTEDGSTDVQTTIQAVELTYDNEDCVIDGAITKTLMNPDTVAPGGQAVFEVTVTNNGTEPLPFNAQEDRGIFDIFSPSLELVSTESDDVDVQCQDFGTLEDAFGGGDPSSMLPYQNHLDYHIAMCASQSSALIPVGETWSFTTTFDVRDDATEFLNFVSWALAFESLVDPGIQTFIETMGTLTPGGDDLLDLLLRGEIASDNIALASYSFADDSAEQSDQLASSGHNTLIYLLIALISIAGATRLYNKRAHYTIG